MRKVVGTSRAVCTRESCLLIDDVDMVMSRLLLCLLSIVSRLESEWLLSLLHPVSLSPLLTSSFTPSILKFTSVARLPSGTTNLDIQP